MIGKSVVEVGLTGATIRIALDRRHSFSGQKNLDWFFANRKWIRVVATPLPKSPSRNTVVEAAWAKRPLPPDETGVRFLLIAPKRNYKRAHDRNKIKRWLRAAIAEADVFARIDEKMLEHAQQLIVMMKISKPIPSLSWDGILNDVRQIGARLSEL